jgi:hypothetical protein
MEKTFLIYMDSFDPSSGGQVAMHKLCHDIKSIGRVAYITSKSTHYKLNSPFLGDSTILLDDCVVVYPEIVHGNPINAKHVVRWILNTPGNCGGVGDGFYRNKSDTDLIFKYSSFFHYDGKINGYLRCSFIDYDIFKNTNKLRDISECFLVKKGGMSKQYHSNNAINLAHYQHNWEATAELFNRCEKFYCYDNECFWVTLAALCGCTVIVIPNTDLTSHEWKTHFPYNKYGIAFGIDELEWANNSKHLVLQNCLDHQIEDLKSVKVMINKCDNL